MKISAFEFHKYFRLGSILLGGIHGDYKPGWNFSGGRVPSSYAFKLQVGKGAGYIHGLTFFFARNSGSAKWWRTFRRTYCRNTPFGFELGWTRNGNQIPYVSH